MDHSGEHRVPHRWFGCSDRESSEFVAPRNKLSTNLCFNYASHSWIWLHITLWISCVCLFFCSRLWERWSWQACPLSKSRQVKIKAVSRSFYRGKDVLFMVCVVLAESSILWIRLWKHWEVFQSLIALVRAQLTWCLAVTDGLSIFCWASLVAAGFSRLNGYLLFIGRYPKITFNSNECQIYEYLLFSASQSFIFSVPSRSSGVWNKGSGFQRNRTNFQTNFLQRRWVPVLCSQWLLRVSTTQIISASNIAVNLHYTTLVPLNA